MRLLVVSLTLALLLWPVNVVWAAVEGCYLMENNTDFYLMENNTDFYALEGGDGGLCSGGGGPTPVGIKKWKKYQDLMFEP
jgi:hypothetical protein